MVESAPRHRRRILPVSLCAALLVAAGTMVAPAVAEADRVDRLVRRAERKYDKQEFERAAELFTEADRAAEGRSPEAIAGLARSSLQLLRFDQALAAAERLIDGASTPEVLAAGHQYRGLALHRRGLSERWAEHIEGRGGVAPGDLKALSEPSTSEASMRAAAEAFRRAVGLLGEGGEGLHYVLLNLADVLSWLDEDEEALAVLDAYAAAGGADPYAEDVRCSVQFAADGGRSGNGLVEAGPRVIGGEIEKPMRIHSPQPQYTDAARAARLEGLVILQAIVNEEGTIDCVRPLLAEHYSLAHNALAAVEKWRFEPARLDGEPVAVFFNLTVNFTLQ